MNLMEWMYILPQYLILFPAAVSCYLPMKHQMKYSAGKTAALCLAVLIPYMMLAARAQVAFHLDSNTPLLPFLPVFFLLYRRTVDADLARSLAVYVSVCAVLTFTAYWEDVFIAFCYPQLWDAGGPVQASLLQAGLACLVSASFFLLRRPILWSIDRVDSLWIWYSITAISGLFLAVNLLLVPDSPELHYAGGTLPLLPLLEACIFMLLACVYVLFYQGARLMWEQVQSERHSQLLEMESHQYRALQEHMRQTARLRHDFRHSIRLLSALAVEEDLAGVRTHLAEYERSLTEHVPAVFCANAALNALFGYYYEMAVSAGVDTDWRIELPDPLTVSELDMAGLFGNLLENGIKGCQTLPEGERRFSLTTELRQGNSLYIVSTNTFDGRICKGQGGYYSTRHDGHGIGLKSIAAVTEKYGGSVRFSHSDTEFFVDVVMKV